MFSFLLPWQVSSSAWLAVVYKVVGSDGMVESWSFFSVVVVALENRKRVTSDIVQRSSCFPQWRQKVAIQNNRGLSEAFISPNPEWVSGS